ncbi:hypothetical protein EI94DRAFT_1706430 [Lactarius quietus]|nr:hypothetical protein EI94DRAFT_1706430 [Lactarius quietus]
MREYGVMVHHWLAHGWVAMERIAKLGHKDAGAACHPLWYQGCLVNQEEDMCEVVNNNHENVGGENEGNQNLSETHHVSVNSIPVNAVVFPQSQLKVSDNIHVWACHKSPHGPAQRTDTICCPGLGMTSGTLDSGWGDNFMVETSLGVREEHRGDGPGGVKMLSSLPIGTGGSYTGAHGASLSLNVKSGMNTSPLIDGGDRITGKWDGVGLPSIVGTLALVLKADPIDPDRHGAGQYGLKHHEALHGNLLLSFYGLYELVKENIPKP